MVLTYKDGSICLHKMLDYQNVVLLNEKIMENFERL